MTEDERTALERLGLPEVPEIVEAVAVPIERGHHLALLAGEGSGKQFVYGLAAIHDVDPASPELQALVLSPTRESAARAARAVHALAAAEGLEVLLWPPEGAEAGAEIEPPLAHVLVGRPERLLGEVRQGRLGLGHLKLLVLDGVRDLVETGAWPAAETLLDAAEGEVRRIAVTDAFEEPFPELLERRLPRARRWPRELFPEALAEKGGRGGTPSGDGTPLHVATATGEEERLRVLAAGLRVLAEEAEEERAFVHCEDEAEAHETAAALSVSGFRLADEPWDPGVTVVWGEEEPPEGGVAAVVGVPSGLDGLRSLLGTAGRRLLVARPAELRQVELLARRAGWRVRVLPPPPSPEVLDEVERFRELLREEAGRTDPSANLLLLEPLLEEMGAARVAAIAAALLRRRPEVAERGPGAPGAAETTGAAPPPRGRAAPTGAGQAERRRDRLVERATRPTWTRIHVNVGKRDGAGPGDLVGAITGETPAAGGQIGKIEIRDRYSLVDLDSQVADQVLAGLQGARIKGREVEAKPDRGPAGRSGGRPETRGGRRRPDRERGG